MKKPRSKNGQFAHAKFDRVCKCGARLGEHMAERPRDLERTECPGFKPTKPALYRVKESQ